MVDLAEQQCGDLSNVTHEQGDAVDLPVDDDRFDAAVSVQAIEYLETVEAGVSELARVLKPGGRAVVYVTDWDSVVWHSSDRDLMRRILETWQDHCPRPHVASDLGRYFHNAGLTIDSVEPYSILDTRSTGDAYAYHLLELIKDYVADHDSIRSEGARSWADDLRTIDEHGETSTNQTSYLYQLRTS